MSVSEIITLYETMGALDYIGEDISQLEHALQAFVWAKKSKIATNITLFSVACFLHDCGQLLSLRNGNSNSLGDDHHEQVGADWLQQAGWCDYVVQLVRNHVSAKRYLIWKYPEYKAKLSPASQATLFVQGGSFTDQEAKDFLQQPLAEEFIEMRLIDDSSKERFFKVESVWEEVKAALKNASTSSLKPE